jgi:hypothetical protein
MTPNKKMSHMAASYRPAKPGATRRCATCSMYRTGTSPSCTLVESPIRPQDTCDYWEAKRR